MGNQPVRIAVPFSLLLDGRQTPPEEEEPIRPYCQPIPAPAAPSTRPRRLSLPAPPAPPWSAGTRSSAARRRRISICQTWMLRPSCSGRHSASTCRPSAHRGQVVGIHLQPHHRPALLQRHHAAEGPDRLGQHHAGAAVQDAGGLDVALDPPAWSPGRNPRRPPPAGCRAAPARSRHASRRIRPAVPPASRCPFARAPFVVRGRMAGPIEPCQTDYLIQVDHRLMVDLDITAAHINP